ncbi:MAG TPA: EamA family transporter [Candidatus Aquilonibacter sp.]|nr:EamA family transporter [Candidatus Aquilonibacter sp.]
MTTIVILYFIVVVVGTGGEMCISRATKEIGEVHDFRPHAIARHVLAVVKVPWLWLGISMMAAAFFALMGMLSMANASLVFPATALNYAVGAIGGKFFLKERVTAQRWLGVTIVCVGVVLVVLGKG